MSLTLAQVKLIEFVATEIIEYASLMNKVKGMTDEECDAQFDAQVEVKKSLRERLDAHGA